jgi:hypothetical protein
MGFTSVVVVVAVVVVVVVVVVAAAAAAVVVVVVVVASKLKFPLLLRWSATINERNHSSMCSLWPKLGAGLYSDASGAGERPMTTAAAPQNARQGPCERKARQDGRGRCGPDDYHGRPRSCQHADTAGSSGHCRHYLFAFRRQRDTPNGAYPASVPRKMKIRTKDQEGGGGRRTALNFTARVNSATTAPGALETVRQSRGRPRQATNDWLAQPLATSRRPSHLRARVSVRWLACCIP